MEHELRHQPDVAFTNVRNHMYPTRSEFLSASGRNEFLLTKPFSLSLDIAQLQNEIENRFVKSIKIGRKHQFLAINII